jgi:serine protease Do
MEERRSMPIGLVVGVSAITSTIVFLLLTFSGPLWRPWLMPLEERLQSSRTSTSTSIAVTPFVGESDEDQTERVVQAAQPAVVAVVITADLSRLPRRSSLFDFEEFTPSPLFPFEIPENGHVTSTPERRRIGGGSGFFVSPDGILVTNKHVVDHATIAEAKPEFSVVTNEGKSYPATVLATDPVLDLAFLKVNGDAAFPYLEIGDSEKIVPGQTVIAIGNALDEFRNSVTKGVVSGLNRRIFAASDAGGEVIEEAIQTDAAINPGNSGGPLLDLHGRVVGINTAVSERGQSLGFALPAGSIARGLESLKKFGKIMRPFLGVRYVILNEDVAKEYEVTQTQGALVIKGSERKEAAVVAGSPADKAGIREGDIIREVNGQPVDEQHSLATLVGKYQVGDTIQVKLFRNSEEKILSVKLEEYQ